MRGPCRDPVAIFALPAELVLADDFNAKIRDRLISETHLAFNNREFHPEAPQIIERLQATFGLVQADRDVTELFNSLDGREAFVIATGPSLEQHFETLRGLNDQPGRPLLVCVDTAYRPLINHGIRPDIVVSIDQRISTQHLPSQNTGAISLVYMPMADPVMLRAWQGPRYCAYSSSPIYGSLRQQSRRGELHVGGSVIHPAVDLAVKMGAAHITLFGADFAFPNDKTHAGWGMATSGRNWARQNTGCWMVMASGSRPSSTFAAICVNWSVLSPTIPRCVSITAVGMGR